MKDSSISKGVIVFDTSHLSHSSHASDGTDETYGLITSRSHPANRRQPELRDRRSWTGAQRAAEKLLQPDPQARSGSASAIAAHKTTRASRAALQFLPAQQKESRIWPAKR